MKLSKMTFVIAMTVVFPAGAVLAQSDQVGLVQPGASETTEANLSNYNYYAQDDASAKPGDAPKVADCGAGKTCGGCNRCSGEPWTLFDNECRDLNIGGWLQFGYHTQGANAVGTGLFNNFPNNFQAQQLWLYIEREADNGGSGWGWGYRFDYVYGTDGQNTQAFGGRALDWDNSWDNGVAYGNAIPQLYLDLAHDDNLNIKLGHFYTIAGYEVVPAVDNFFYSHAYTMVLAEPFTHTGVLAEYTTCGGATVWAGWTEGWDTGFSRNGGSTFLGGISKELSNDLTFTWTMTAGDFGFDVLGVPGSDSNGFSQTIVVSYDICENLTYVFQSDYVDNTLFVATQATAALGLAATTSQILSINQYLLYEVNECLAVGARFEWIDLGGFEGGEATLGANIRPHANVVIRPEVRLDYFETGVKTATGIADSTTFGIDAIFIF